MSSFEAAGSDEDLHRSYIDQMISDRRDEGDRLLRRAQALLKADKHRKAKRRAEVDARGALGLYRASLDWAEDTDREEDAHRRLDDAGRWVRRTFACHLERKGDQYFDTCPVKLAHNRIGLSVGGRSAKRVCSLCGLDVSECEHLPGIAYLVPGGTDELGWCRVCSNADCAEHSPTATYRASVVSIIQKMELDEVSIVTKPAHPEARIHSISISISELRSRLGERFKPGMDVSCDRCLSDCGGLIRHGEIRHG